jgi:hypothetical protein
MASRILLLELEIVYEDCADAGSNAAPPTLETRPAMFA